MRTSDPREGGRYDLPAPNGSCYLADDVHTCVLEVVADELVVSRGPQLLAATELRARRRVTLTADADTGPFANLDAPASYGYGVAGDLHATDNRRLTQQWARALHEHGHVGVRGHARTPPAGTATTWTLFGPAGPGELPPVPTGRLRMSPPATLHDDVRLISALAAHGVDVLPVPGDVDTD